MIIDITKSFSKDSEYKKLGEDLPEEGAVIVGHRHNYKVIYDKKGNKTIKTLPDKLDIYNIDSHTPSRPLEKCKEGSIYKGKDGLEYTVVFGSWKLNGGVVKYKRDDFRIKIENRRRFIPLFNKKWNEARDELRKHGVYLGNGGGFVPFNQIDKMKLEDKIEKDVSQMWINPLNLPYSDYVYVNHRIKQKDKNIIEKILLKHFGNKIIFPETKSIAYQIPLHQP